MRILAIDYGDARTGLAVSDATGTIAGEAWVVYEKNPAVLAKLIAQEAAAREVQRIVVGYPRNMDGTSGFRAQKSEDLIALLKSECDIDIIPWDERMTTMSANRILTEAGKRGQKRKKTIDAVAAALILESYLLSL
ncbi:MAG: Holliday junction resolvase RuvX [Oscillospiraceae bacterium]|nr:Holliday junction resolvase RuvX [Oscillospiraceae bacterium]